jgi:hypothetical protein
MVVLTVVHTVFGALVFAASILVVLMCYRLVPRRGTVAVRSRPQAQGMVLRSRIDHRPRRRVSDQTRRRF